MSGLYLLLSLGDASLELLLDRGELFIGGLDISSALRLGLSDALFAAAVIAFSIIGVEARLVLEGVEQLGKRLFVHARVGSHSCVAHLDTNLLRRVHRAGLAARGSIAGRVSDVQACVELTELVHVLKSTAVKGSQKVTMYRQSHKHMFGLSVESDSVRLGYLPDSVSQAGGKGDSRVEEYAHGNQFPVFLIISAINNFDQNWGSWVFSRFFNAPLFTHTDSEEWKYRGPL